MRLQGAKQTASVAPAPAGRGRHTTQPAWMTRQQDKGGLGTAAAPLASRVRESSAPTARRHRAQGRAKGRTEDSSIDGDGRDRDACNDGE